jgi:hypothetical protein
MLLISSHTLKRWPCTTALNFLYCGFNGKGCDNGIPKQSRVNMTVVLKYKTGANEIQTVSGPG